METQEEAQVKVIKVKASGRRLSNNDACISNHYISPTCTANELKRWIALAKKEMVIDNFELCCPKDNCRNVTEQEALNVIMSQQTFEKA